MAGWPEGLLINKSIHRNIDSVLVFRFHPHYVNSLILLIFSAMLHNLNQIKNLSDRKNLNLSQEP